ncbi:MAG: hypothetical protein GWN87_24890 [Desulfuromonadales bacterium]|nr:hypothetical protein [Desulfuromonadales bacterium]
MRKRRFYKIDVHMMYHEILIMPTHWGARLVIKCEGVDEINRAALDEKIEDQKISKRARNCLIKSGIITIRDLVRDDIYTIPGIGPKMRSEIKELITNKGLFPGMPAFVLEPDMYDGLP